MTDSFTRPPPAPAAAPHRSVAGAVRLGQRDINGLIICAEHYGAPHDLLGAAQPARLRGIISRWRRAGYPATGRLGPGPAWCWLTPAEMGAAGFSYRAGQPSLARLAHIRAVLAARLWLASSPAWDQSRPWWESERRVAAAVRRGASNRAIAAELFLSPKTVEFHLRQIYRKLGVHSRTQLIATLADQPDTAQTR